MARPARVLDDTHRREQRRYRKRLRTDREPEVGKVDTAVTVAVYAYLRKVLREDRDAAGKADLDFLLATANDVLVAMHADRSASRRVLKRRLAKASKRFDKLLGDDGDPHYVAMP